MRFTYQTIDNDFHKKDYFDWGVLTWIRTQNTILSENVFCF